MCENGYRREGDECIKIYVPENAQAIGDRWMCKDGYHQDGDRCDPFEVPSNARAIGGQWLCKDGFRKSGNTCVPIAVPPNARAVGDQWVCNVGYKKNGDGCAEMTRDELMEFADYLARALVRTQAVCESLCDQVSSNADECGKRCRGE